MTPLTVPQLDALQELLNIGVGRSAGMLNQMLGLHVQLQVPVIKVAAWSEIKLVLEQELGLERVAAVRLGFNGSFSGVANLVFPPSSAAKLVAALMSEDGDNPDDLDALRTGTLSEVGNVVLNGVMGEMSNLLHQHLRYAIPTYAELPVNALVLPDNGHSDSTKPVLLAKTRFIVQQLLITGNIILIFNIGAFDNLLAALEELLEVNCEQSSQT